MDSKIDVGALQAAMACYGDVTVSGEAVSVRRKGVLVTFLLTPGGKVTFSISGTTMVREWPVTGVDELHFFIWKYGLL